MLEWILAAALIGIRAAIVCCAFAVCVTVLVPVVMLAISATGLVFSLFSRDREVDE